VSTSEDRSGNATVAASNANGEMKLEVVVIPVSDVGRAKEFYGRLGWRLDVDRTGDEFRLVQFTPPGSQCSVRFGTNLTSAPAGSAQALLLSVTDLLAAHEDLARRAVKVSEVFHCETGTACRFRDGDGIFRRAGGLAPGRASYFSLASFSDPDGNGWLFQEVTTRLPGRVDPGVTSFRSASELAAAMKRAAAAHGEHERRIGHADANWPEWHAAFMAADQDGSELPE
jgi:catechol 2,3-dioxygenase-like lactoylglutathione lyase family enzyme